MTFIVIVQLLLGTNIQTGAKLFETAYPCYEEAYLLSTGQHPMNAELKEKYGDDVEIIARCYTETP